MEKLVSIVIPAYNVGSYLDYCITSLVKQSYENIEISDALVNVYNLQGVEIEQPKQGVNILRYENGIVKKFIVK